MRYPRYFRSLSPQYHWYAGLIHPSCLANPARAVGKTGCHLLIRHMALLFVPIGVGVMNYYDLVSQQFGPIVVSCLISTFIVMLVVGFSTQIMQRERAMAGDRTPPKDNE